MNANRSDIYNTGMDDEWRAQAYLIEASAEDPVRIANFWSETPVLVTPYDRIEMVDNWFMADEPVNAIENFGRDWAMEYTKTLWLRALIDNGLIPLYEAADYVRNGGALDDACEQYEVVMEELVALCREEGI